jgi:uncharacterized protein
MKGIEYILLAKAAISSEFSGKKIRIPDYKELKEKRGCFVTLKKKGELRGCIGFPYPTHELGRAIILAAKSAAFSDPRFPPLEESEFIDIKIEISILSVPKEIAAELEDIMIGRDGLMCEYNGHGGLLLPQVAVEQEWNAKQFLEGLCNKAGLPLDSWKEKEFRLWKFSAKIFEEDELMKEK